MEKKKLNKIKNILVIVSLIIYIICTYISLRGEYLECLELGNQYIQNFWTIVKYKYSLMGISFIIIAIAQIVGYLPWIPVFLKQANAVSNGYWIPLNWKDTVEDPLGVQFQRKTNNYSNSNIYNNYVCVFDISNNLQ